MEERLENYYRAQEEMRKAIRGRLEARVAGSASGTPAPAVSDPAGVPPAAAPREEPPAAAAERRAPAPESKGPATGKPGSLHRSGSGGRERGAPKGEGGAKKVATQRGGGGTGEGVSAGSGHGWRRETPPSAAAAEAPLGAAAPEPDVPFLIMTVDIGGGRSGRIEVCEGDSPRDLADSFIRLHKLPGQIVEPLAAHISENVARVRSEKGAATSAGTGGEGWEGENTGPQKRPLPRVARQSVQRRPGSAHSAARGASGKLPSRQRPQTARKADPKTFERLHGHARERTVKQTETKKRRDEAEASRIKANKVGMSWASRQMMAGRGTGEFENYGERLYVEGLIAKQRQRRAEQRSLEERERREVEGVTFKPKISKASREITRNMRKQEVFVARDPKAAERERQMEAMKREREERELKECTFKPRINRRSETLVAERTEALREYDIQTHEQLYQDAAARKERQAQYAEWRPDDMTFKPKTNATMNTHEADGDKEDIVERLYLQKARSDAIKEQTRRFGEGFDLNTGREFFKPRTGRAPRFVRNSDDVPVWDYLYGMRYEFDDKKEFMAALDEQRMSDSMDRVRITERSEKLMLKLKRRRFRQIFNYLDQSGRGRINLGELQGVERLDLEVRADLEHAAALAGEEELDFELFVLWMDQGISANPGPRGYLKPQTRNRDAGPEQPEDSAQGFRPEVNERSKMIAERRRGGMSFQDAVRKDQEATKAKLLALKKEAESRELENCTFKPKTNTTNPLRRSARGGGKGYATMAREQEKAKAARVRLTDQARYEGEQRFLALERELQAVLQMSPGHSSGGVSLDASAPGSPQSQSHDSEGESHYELLQKGATLYALETSSARSRLSPTQ